ncbi:MAG: hypothetical protein HDR23_00800 [Lachnospiraceae bacterium]|nr:hypothetical protein [Lachnospiraceae bacterium]
MRMTSQQGWTAGDVGSYHALADVYPKKEAGKLQNRKAKYAISPTNIPANIKDSRVGELIKA